MAKGRAVPPPREAAAGGFHEQFLRQNPEAWVIAYEGYKAHGRGALFIVPSTARVAVEAAPGQQTAVSEYQYIPASSDFYKLMEWPDDITTTMVNTYNPERQIVAVFKDGMMSSYKMRSPLPLAQLKLSTSA